MDRELKNVQNTATISTTYDQTLRAIGQALEPLQVQDFDLDIDGNHYTVRGQSAAQETKKEAKRGGLRNVFKDAWGKFEAKSPEQSTTQLSSPFLVLELHFGPEDIDRLEHQGRSARRPDSKGATNPHKLSQVLRAVGAYAKRKSLRLTKVSKRKDWVAIEYKTIQGRSDVENFRTTDLYDFWIHLYKQRKNS